MKVIKALLKYIGWPAFLFGLIIGVLFMYNVNGNRQALYNVKEICQGEDCIAFQQLYNNMNKICSQSIGGIYFDNGCVKENDVKECVQNEGYLNCLGKKEFEEIEEETEYFNFNTGKRFINILYQRYNIIDYITDIKNINTADTERIIKLVNENRKIKSELTIANMKEITVNSTTAEFITVDHITLGTFGNFTRFME